MRRNNRMTTYMSTGVAIIVMLAAAVQARAASYTSTLAANRAAVSSISPSLAQASIGAGSWFELYPSSKTEIYVSPTNDLGVTFNIEDITSISYRTFNVANPSPVEFFLVIYTKGPGIGPWAHGWYEERLNAEPYLKKLAYVPATGVWSTWSTGGADELTFTDHNHAGNLGFYNAPTLAEIKAATPTGINWSTWGANPTSGSASVTPFDYATQEVLYLGIQTGSGWAGFNGYVDEIVITLDNGDDYTLDLEATPGPIYVDDAWVGTPGGTPLGGGKTFGFNAFDTISGGIGAAMTGATVNVAPGTYAAFTLNKSIDLVGAQAGVDACGRVVGLPNPAVESIVTGAGTLMTLVTGCAGSTVDGFCFSGGTRSIESASGPLHGLELLNNHMSGFTGAAVFLNDPGDDITVHQNDIDGTAKLGGGGLFHLDTDLFRGFYFTSNCVKNSAPGTGFFVDGNHNVAPNGPRTPRFNDNLFQSLGTGANLGRFAFTGGTISGNTFTLSGFDGLQGGIQLTAITDNVFSFNGRSGLALTGFGGATDPTRGAQNSTITLNDFIANVREGLFYSSGQFPGTVSTNVANNNNFVGNGTGGSNHGVNYVGTELLNLTCNWWNSAAGPDTLTNPNPPADDIGAAGALFVQWLVAPAPGGLCAGGEDITPGPAPSCISTETPCITIPVDFNRVNTTPVRGFSVTLQLSPELILCAGPSSITEGSYLNGIGLTNFQVLDNGGGSYTVDGAILGLPCGATGSGTLFNLDVTNSGGDGTGTITVTSVIARNCSNVPVAAYPGPALSITIDNTVPAAIANLAAVQQKTGNDVDGTTKIALTFTAPGDAATIEVYRAGFGNYPEYNDAPGAGSVPATPSYPPGSPWVLTSVTASGQSDETTTRDFWYYVVFSKDACDNVSAVSNKTGGTLNYHLGDTHNGGADCSGDNKVDTSDISFLGGNYGIALGVSDPLGCLDVGPTTDFSVDARPTTDNQIQFEDLIMFAINHAQVSAPDRIDSDVTLESATDVERIELRSSTEATATGGPIVELWGATGGRIQGLSARLEWNAAAVTPVDVESGELLTRQGRSSTVLSAQPGTVDLALLGVGRGIEGSGALARVRFMVIGEGDPAISLVQVDARDRQNRKVDVVTDGSVVAAAPRTTSLGNTYPNPFRNTTQIPLAIGAAGPIRLTVFDVQGRLVRTLVDGVAEAGSRTIEWDGRDSGGRAVSAGVYAIRFEAGGQLYSRTVQLVK